VSTLPSELIETPPFDPDRAIEGRSPWQLAWARLRHDRVAIVCLVVIVLITLIALAAPLFVYLTGHGPNEEFQTTGLTPDGLPHGPSSTFLFGTDSLGRDVLGQLMLGAQVSLIVSVVSVIVSGAIGIVLGLLAGYFGGRFDQVIMRLVDLQMSIPSLLIALLVLYILGPSLTNVVLVLSVTRWMVYARVTRGLMLSLKEVLFVEAARSLGASDLRIIFRHMLPNVAGPLAVLATLELALMLLTEASLDFLGLGIQPPETSWGLMLSDGQQYLTTAWWLVAFPGLAIMLTSLCINLVATSIRANVNAAGGPQAAEPGATTQGLEVGEVTV
jgi:peptide/nickel transport system permease protein